MRNIMKVIIKINIIILPILLALNIIRAANNPEEHKVIDFNYFVWYAEQFPSEDWNNLKTDITGIANGALGFEELDPDWSGSIWSDIAEIGELIADIFTNIWKAIKWFFECVILLVKVALETVWWALTLPYNVINY